VIGIRAGGWGIVFGTLIAAVVIAAFAYATREARRRANTVLANGIAAGLVPLQRKVTTTVSHRGPPNRTLTRPVLSTDFGYRRLARLTLSARGSPTCMSGAPCRRSFAAFFTGW
jgi:hypothetical protein